MAVTGRQAITQFMAARRIAVIGVSRDSRHFSRNLFRTLISRGYHVIPVNPQASEIEGLRCYASVIAIEPTVDAALLFTTGAATDAVVRECAGASIPCVWMYRAAGIGAVTESAVEFCLEQNITVVPGECPYMFLPHAGCIHALHGFARRLIGTYPA
jgi:predicted CoA-binding protein